jgi:hypothetical protein
MPRGWRADIRELAACLNVYVKLGGLAMIVNAFDFHLAPLPPSSGELVNAWRPYVESCIEAFGAQRCMLRAISRSTRAHAVTRYCLTRSSGWRAAHRPRKSDLFASTASDFYRLSHIGL